MWAARATWVSGISQSPEGKCHHTSTQFCPLVATGEYWVGYSVFSRLQDDHLISTFFFTSGTSVEINVVLMYEIIEKISMGFKYFYLMIPLSNYVFISPSLFFFFFFIMNYVILGTGDLLQKIEDLSCHVKLWNLTERCFWSLTVINWASFNPNKAYHQTRVSSMWTAQADTLEK